VYQHKIRLHKRTHSIPNPPSQENTFYTKSAFTPPPPRRRPLHPPPQAESEEGSWLVFICCSHGVHVVFTWCCHLLPPVVLPAYIHIYNINTHTHTHIHTHNTHKHGGKSSRAPPKLHACCMLAPCMHVLLMCC
jgi:hypothetical protein